MGERSKKSWIAISMNILIILAAWASYTIHGFSVLAQDWVPYVPPSDIVTLYNYMVDTISYVNVSIAFPHPEFNVSDWGVPTIVGGDITVNATIWQYTGPVPPLVTIVEHAYELGELPPGEYKFTFMVWDIPVKSLTFSITHDIAITNVWPKKNIVGQGFPAFIMVNVTNEGDFTEIFNLTVYYNGEPAPLLIERWYDPTGELSDAFWSIGDVNRDGYVDYYDVYLFYLYAGWTGQPGENPVDVNMDGWVEVFDLMIISQNFNLTIWDYFGIPPIIQDFAVVRLNITGFKIIGFRWNTTNFAKGNYTISAYAWPVPEETDIEDNHFIDSWVLITIPGDVNADGIVDIFDCVIIALLIDVDIWNPNYNPNADINDDLIIDIFDIVIVGLNFARQDP